MILVSLVTRSNRNSRISYALLSRSYLVKTSSTPLNASSLPVNLKLFTPFHLPVRENVFSFMAMMRSYEVKGLSTIQVLFHLICA